MKKWMIYLGGVLTGIVLTALLSFFLCNTLEMGATDNTVTKTVTKKNTPDGVKMFKSPGEIIDETSFEVFQVIAENAALVNGKGDGYSLYMGPVYLMINDEGKYYYDDEIINISGEKTVRQVGIYRYETKDNLVKTVPIITIYDN